MPKTKLGKWAGVLLAIFLVSLVIVYLFLNLLDFKRGSLEILIPGICMPLAGIGAFATGMISRFRFKDRSFVVILAIIFGFIGVLIFAFEGIELIVNSLK